MEADLEAIGRGHFGKKQYSSEALVQKVIREAERKRGQALRYYMCQLCGTYHIAKVRS